LRLVYAMLNIPSREKGLGFFENLTNRRYLIWKI
jgi:hypothetical protein